MSLTSDGSTGGPGQVAVSCEGVPSGGGGALLCIPSGRFEKCTLRRVSSPDKRFFNIHLCHSPKPLSLGVFCRERRSAAQQIHNLNQRRQFHRPRSHSRKEQSQQAQTVKQQEHTLRNGQRAFDCFPLFHFFPPPLCFHFYFPRAFSRSQL